MKKIILLLFIFFFCFTFSSAQTFSNSISEAAGSWNGTLTKTVNVSGISNLNSGIFELVQVNLSMGDNANTRNYNTYRITLTKGTTTIDLVAVGGLPNSTIKQINTKFRFNPYLRRLFEHGGTAEPFSIGYYRSQDDFTSFNGIDPNGTWTITITETSFATGGRFNNVDLVFKTPYTVQDYTTLNSYDNCATPYCLGTAEIIVASNNGFTNQTSDMYNPNTTGCNWNAAQNNSAWFKFRAAQANASITISGITNNIQILGIDAGPDDNPCTNNDNTVLNGGCPTLVTNDTYATPQYTNGSTKNNQLNLSGLTPGKYYYFIVDGTSSAVSPFYIETLGASLDCSNCNLNPTVASNSPVCENSTLNLTCSEGVSWEWSGPNGFSSTEQNPTIPNVSLLANGTYTVTITDANNCSETRTVDVQISAIVTPLFNASSPVCSGTTINALPTTSNNGIEGTWSPALNNTATTTYTFAPNTGQCATNATITIQINDCDFGAYASAVWMDDCFTPGDGKFYNTTGSGVDLINQEPGNTFAQNFGVHIQNSSTLIMRGSEVKTYKNGNTNVCGATLYYRYYLNSGTGGSFTGRNLGFFSDCNTGTNEFNVGGGPCVAGQQKWQCVSQPSCDSPINLTNVPPGDYTLEVYYEISGDFNSTSQCDDTILLNNGGTNYKAFFSIITLPQVTGSNPTNCNVPNGSITLAGLTLNETYTIQYTFGTTTVGPINYLSNDEGSIVIPNLGIGTYSNFSIEINNCTTLLPDVVTLQNPISTPLFSTPNPICNGASIDATVFPTVSNNGISGVWSPEFTNTVTTVYTFTPLANQCANTTTLTLVVNPAITANTNTSPNTVCNGSSSLCVPSGDHVVINEVMHFPTTAQGLVANGTEYIELYNPTCDPVDLSCYTLATAAKPNANPGSVLSRGGTIILPFGTTILPKSHFVIGTSTSAVNLSDIDFNTTVNSTYCAINQFVLANGDGWVGLYNANGNPVDAIYWTVNANESQKISTDDDLDDAPCIPNSIPSCSTTGLNLLSAKEIYLLDPTLISYVGQTTILGLGSTGNTFSRMPDGGLWQRNIPGSIILNCNSGICDTPTSTSCNGTATVTITQGSGNYSYLWNDPLAQTTSTAINLCAGNYCVSVTDLDTNCTQEFCVTVNDDIPLVNPTFDFGNNLSICAGAAVPNLPATSANGIQGTWNPIEIDNTSNGTYTFTPEANQCATAFTYTVSITPEVIPIFNFGTSLTICEGVSPQVLLPSLSNNSISGTWNPPTIDASILGQTIYTFTPDAGQCATITTFTVTVNPQTTTSFNFGNNLSICAGSAVPNLPTTSANGIQGTWNPTAIDNTSNGTYTFTPNANQCSTTFAYSVIVTPVVVPTFGFGNNLSICAGSAVPNLPTTSANGIQGTWNPTAIDNTANGTYTFTPNANQCSTTFAYSVSITPGV
ncbi:MAG: lamin tail domain-containing protein, partial [Flavobacterium sp.]|nr:lamin tail domain-containing protein [Flavobacterium sp.]